MVNQDEYNEILSYAMQAMALMLKNKTPATPENFAKWYNHAAELFSSGKCDGESRQEAKSGSNPEVSDPGVKLEQPDDNLTAIETFQISKVKDLVEKTTSETSAFNGSMDDLTKKLEAFKQKRMNKKAKAVAKPSSPAAKPAFSRREGKFIPLKG